MLKNRYCGQLRAADAGTTATLAGWVHRRRDHGGLTFLDLRDSTGIVQVVVNPTLAPAAHEAAQALRSEYVVRIVGEIVNRQPGAVNPRLPTGEIEVQALTVEVLNPSKTPPFPINDESEPAELTRLTYRYLDLRRPDMAERLRLRHQVVNYIRTFLNDRGFIEVETPILLKSTPEGARDYLVPSRVHPGAFYALPQSPQQLKQLLMVAGVERYFQIARCFRDEDLRADRQPEFTQLDLEMSFVEEKDILDLMEALFIGMTRTLRPDVTIPDPFPRLTYAEAMERFGSDKPDLRYGMEIFDITDLVAGSEFGVFRSAVESRGRVRGIAVPGSAEITRRQIDELTEIAKGRGAKGLVTAGLLGDPAAIQPDQIRSPVARFLSPTLIGEIAARSGATSGDLLLLVADTYQTGNTVLDTLRREMASRLDLARSDEFSYLFVTDFPLFEWNADRGRWDSAHHPFTAPKEEDLSLLDRDPGRVRSKAYDLVCNGWELGSGSIRIHDRAVQSRIFSLLDISDEEQQDRFGHMLDAFEYGAPPHGGVAPGIDRTVALLAGVGDIREVIAFPKTKTAADPMTGAPSTVDAAQLRDLHIAVTE
ncbi:MAG: aspartate--tRNA ligase [Dehalococcoidia bacterium]